MTARGCTEKQERASPSDAEGGARNFCGGKEREGTSAVFLSAGAGDGGSLVPVGHLPRGRPARPAPHRPNRVERGTAGAGGAAAGPPPLDRGGRRQSASARPGAGSPCACSRLCYTSPLGGGAGPQCWALEHVSRRGAGQLAMGCCVLAGLAGGCFKAGTQRTVEELSWMQGELEGLRSRPGFLKEHTRPVEWDQKNERAPCLAPAGCGGRFWNRLGA